MGLTFKEIICFLGLQHRILMSKRSLERKLASMNLYRRKLISVSEFFSKLIMADDMQSGYRWMYQRCLLAGYRVPWCGRCQYLYHCLNIKQGMYFNLGTKDNSLCKNITLINDNDNNNCICCFGNDLLIFFIFVCLFVCVLFGYCYSK